MNSKAIIILLVFAIIGIIIYFSGSKENPNDIDTGSGSGSGGGNDPAPTPAPTPAPKPTAPTMSGTALNSLSNELFDAIQTNENRAFVMGKVYAISDADLIELNNRYRDMHNSSMYSDIDNEWMYFDDEDDLLLKRMEKLNLK